MIGMRNQSVFGHSLDTKLNQTMVEANVPLLAMPSGSIVQFLLMTVPLLCVYLYFLYLAYARPSVAADEETYANDRIRLMDILYVYLATLVLFSSLVVYMAWFVPKRRNLSKRYEKEGVIILGDVQYTESYYDKNKLEQTDSDTNNIVVKVYRHIKNCCFTITAWVANNFALTSNYGYVMYDLEKVANHPAYEERKNGKQLNGIIKKQVRVYHRYPREQVSLLILPAYPYSGQPKQDLEADWASFSKYVSGATLPMSEDEDNNEMTSDDEPSKGSKNNIQPKRRDRSFGVLLVSIVWVTFLGLASLYVIHQIKEIDDVYNDEDATKAWIVFWIVIGGIVPLVAMFGNFIRWKIYERWMLHSGSKKKTMMMREENNDEVNGGSYIQMS